MELLTVLAQLIVVQTSDVKTRLEWLLHSPLTGLPKYEETLVPTVETATLGRLLFYDKRLSADGTLSCASCHQVQHAYSANTAVSSGIGGQLGNRKAPPILNKAFLSPQFWDGRANTLEEQASGPLFNPKEMGNTEEKVLATVRDIQGYAEYFARAFGDSGVTIERITRAIADFERTLLSGDSKFDRWFADQASGEFTDEEKLGWELFQDRSCIDCHSTPLFTDNLFHNVGHGYVDGAFLDEGRFVISQVEADKGAFKTPTLRNLVARAPYMHDGSLGTLEDVIELYNKGGVKNPHLSDKIIPLGLQPHEKKAMVAFMQTLEGRGFEEAAPSESEFPR